MFIIYTMKEVGLRRGKLNNFLLLFHTNTDNIFQNTKHLTFASYLSRYELKWPIYLRIEICDFILTCRSWTMDNGIFYTQMPACVIQ